MQRRKLMEAALAAPLAASWTRIAAAAPEPVPPRQAPMRRTPLAAIPIGRMNTPWWRARHEAKLAEIRAHPPRLLMLGDSITQDYELAGPEPWRDFVPVWQHFYGGRDAINLGFKGDATSHLLWRLEHGELDNMQPRAAVLLIGANNMGAPHWGAADTIEGIAAILRRCRARHPAMGVVLVAVLPSIRSAWIDTTTAAINAGLAERYGGGKMPGIAYVDATALFMRDGRVDAERFLDPRLEPPEPPLHPTAQTQARLAAAIEPALAPILGEAARG